MPAIPPHTTGTTDTPWAATTHVGAIPDNTDAGTLRQMYAWVDPAADKATRAAYKFPHHMVSNGKPGDANLRGVRNALARLPSSGVPAKDHADVKAHLDHHLADAQHGETKSAEPGFGRAVTNPPWKL